MDNKIDTVSLMNELNLDETDENTALIGDLISQSEDLIMSSVNYDKPLEDYLKEPIFIRAVKTLVAQMFYDRTLSEGLSKGVQMMINHLKGRLENEQ